MTTLKTIAAAAALGESAARHGGTQSPQKHAAGKGPSGPAGIDRPRVPACHRSIPLAFHTS